MGYINCMAMDSAHSDTLYAGTSYGVCRSIDGAENWVKTSLADIEINAIKISKTNANILIASSDSIVYQSENSGETWEEISTPGTDYIDRSGKVMEIDPEFPNCLYFGANYKGEASVLAFDSEEDSWHYFPGSPLKNPNSFLMHPNYWCLGFSDGGAYMLAAADTLWKPKNVGMNEVKILDLVPNPKDPDKVYGAIDGYMVRTNDGGKNWMMEKISFNSLAMSKKDTSILLAGTAPTGFLKNMDPFYYYRSENGGISWTRHMLFSLNGPIGYSFKLWTGDILLHPSDPDKFIFGIDGGGGAGEGIYITDDGGSSWGVTFGTGVSTLAQDPKDANIVYLGTTASGYVLRSTEGGTNWELISPGGQGAFVGSVWDFGVDKNSQVFAATSSGLFKWESGINWSQVQGLPAINTKAIAINNHPDPPVYYVGTEEQGIYISEDGGLTWDSFNDGLGTLKITRLKINDSYPRNLYAGTNDGGVWITTILENATFTPVIQNPDIAINVFPNPNDGSFSIISNTDSELRGEMKVINLLGKVIYSDNHFNVPPGSVQVVNLDNVSPGNYILVFTSERLTINQKLIICRGQ